VNFTWILREFHANGSREIHMNSHSREIHVRHNGCVDLVCIIHISYNWRKRLHKIFNYVHTVMIQIMHIGLHYPLSYYFMPYYVWLILRNRRRLFKEIFGFFPIRIKHYWHKRRKIVLSWHWIHKGYHTRRPQHQLSSLRTIRHLLQWEIARSDLSWWLQYIRL
jgi:hypothetical protein